MKKKVKLLEQGGRRGLQHVFFPWKARRKSQQKRAVPVTDVGEICQLRSNASTCQPLALALPWRTRGFLEQNRKERRFQRQRLPPAIDLSMGRPKMLADTLLIDWLRAAFHPH